MKKTLTPSRYSRVFNRPTTAATLVGIITALTCPLASAIPCDFQNGDIFSDICAYIEAGSVQLGGQVKVHVSTSRPAFDVYLHRAGDTKNVLQKNSFTNGSAYPMSTTGYNGLNWGSAYNIPLPTSLRSGIYELSFNNGLEAYSEFIAIKSNNPGTTSKILVLDSLPTKIAYSPIGGKSFYGYNSTNGSAAVEVSMERPTGRGQWSEHREFVTWLDSKGITYEAASMMDLQRDPSLLKHYNLVLLVGHNEYWSKEMRDGWDSYIASGGNAAIFSGNTMWWQVRFSSDLKHIICYKNDVSDPLYGVDNTRVTTLWSTSPVNRPENKSIGVSFRNGGYHNYTESGVQHYVKNSSSDDGSYGGFKVTDASHWVFNNTNLTNGAIFGRGNGVNSGAIAGYEIDGALFKMVNGNPVVTGEDGTPTNFRILALTPAYAVNSSSSIEGVVPNNYQGQGWGTMGIFKPSAISGTVFVAPTIDWAEGLKDAQVSRITENVINTLKTRNQQNNPSPTPANSAPSATTSTNTAETPPTVPVATSTTNTPTTNTSSEVHANDSYSSGGSGSSTLLELLMAVGVFFYRKKFFIENINQ